MPIELLIIQIPHKLRMNHMLSSLHTQLTRAVCIQIEVSDSIDSVMFVKQETKRIRQSIEEYLKGMYSIVKWKVIGEILWDELNTNLVCTKLR